MSATLTLITMMDNGFTRRIQKEREFIGMDGLGLNLMIQLKPHGTDPLPASVTVEIKVLSPGGSAATSSFTTTRSEIFRSGDTNEYRGALGEDFFQFLRLADKRNEFAIVIRANDPNMPATADGAFSGPLLKAGWAHRGHGRQHVSGLNSGNAATRAPDARQLLLAGGVEIIEITAVAQPGLVIKDRQTYAFVRSPADVFLYTGHGMLKQMVTHDPHNFWMDADTVLASWKAPSSFGPAAIEPHVLIINGCSILADGNGGEEWEQLLLKNGGPLTCLLGYLGTAPSDGGGGHAVAAAMAEQAAALGDQWDKYAEAWMEVNRKLWTPTGSRAKLINACARDAAGLWTLSDDGKTATVNPP
jgi:hypothetical protein